MNNFKGIGASEGIEIAKAYRLVMPEFPIPMNLLPEDAIDESKQKVSAAFERANEQLREIKAIAQKKLGIDKANIFQAHIEILNDPTLRNQINDQIENKRSNPLCAVSTAFDNVHNIFANMSDAYFKERAADILDLKQRMLAILTNQPLPDLLSIQSEVIIVADDLTPSQTSLLDKNFVKGFITNTGGRTSHAAIIARSLEIPAILGLGNITETIGDNELIAIDGATGIVANSLSAEDIQMWKDKQQDFLDNKNDLQNYLAPVAITKDKHEVVVCGNIGKVSDMEKINKYGGKGVGLFRTEVLYMDNVNWPDEAQQFDSYKAVVQQANNELVIIRTLDIGGDKTLPYYTFESEMNPFLGYRAIRLCLDQPQIFKTQLKALLRAAAFGPLGIMFPMIATIDELKQAKAILNECIDELKTTNVPIGQPLVGMMIEIPSAAVMSEMFAPYVDFFSIGTNDLVQYSFAVDRMSRSVSYLYQPLNPALLRLIKMTIDGGKKHQVWTGMCGEMAGDPLAIPLLLGLGLKEFSMSAASMLKAKKIINSINYQDCVDLANKALNCEDAQSVNNLVVKFLKENNIKI